MSSPAEIIDLDAERAQRGQPLTFSWSSLGMVSDARDHASRCVRLDLHVHAVHGLDETGECTCGSPHTDQRNSRGKHPVGKGWQSLKLDARALDAALARDWRLNLGLRLGEQPNGWRLVAIDVDGPRELLAPLEAKWGTLPRTLTARTGSGGMHFVYRWPDGRAMPPNSVGKLAPHVDVRSTGGHIVIAPAKHHSGTRYTWTNCIEPAVIP